MSDRFFDTNIVLYLIDDGPKADLAEDLLKAGGLISVQVLNETLVNCRRKAKMSWDEVGVFLSGVRDVCDICDLTVEMHDVGRALAERYQISVYDSMIVSAALVSGCTELLSEDMHDGLVIEDNLTIKNPFKASDDGHNLT